MSWCIYILVCVSMSASILVCVGVSWCLLISEAIVVKYVHLLVCVTEFV